MIHTAHSQHGTDERVKLPNFTEQEDVDWQGLVRLYSVNESLFEHRHDYSPGLEDWTNFGKDVDRMFALLRDLKQLNRTNKLDPLDELGSGAGGPEEASGAGALNRDTWTPVITTGPQMMAPTAPKASGASDWTPVITTGPQLMSSSAPMVTLKSANELPEGLPTTHTPYMVFSRGDTWAQQLENELDGDGMTFSGNGLTELETHHHDFLRSGSSGLHRAELDPSQATEHHKDKEEQEEDIFEAQGLLPVSTKPEKLPEQAKAPPAESSPQPLLLVRFQMSQGPQDPHLDPQEPLFSEGSGMGPPPSKKSL